jgi:hypothetical protein
MSGIVAIIVAAVLALLIAVGASYFAVVSQNPGNVQPAPTVVYGSVSP